MDNSNDDIIKFIRNNDIQGLNNYFKGKHIKKLLKLS